MESDLHTVRLSARRYNSDKERNDAGKSVFKISTALVGDVGDVVEVTFKIVFVRGRWA